MQDVTKGGQHGKYEGHVLRAYQITDKVELGKGCRAYQIADTGELSQPLSHKLQSLTGDKQSLASPA